MARPARGGAAKAFDLGGRAWRGIGASGHGDRPRRRVKAAGGVIRRDDRPGGRSEGLAQPALAAWAFLRIVSSVAPGVIRLPS